MRQLLHSISCHNNVVPFHLCWRQIAVTNEKVCKCFVQDCLKIFLLVFTRLKIHWKPKNDQFLVIKVKSLHQYCPTGTQTASGLEFIVDAKAQNSVFWKISYSAIFNHWVTWKHNLKRKWAFSDTTIFREHKIKRSGPS